MMQSSGIVNQNIQFATGQSVPMQQAIDQTMSIVANPDKILPYGFAGSNPFYGRNVPIQAKDSLVTKAKLRAYLADDSIDVSDRLLDRITNISLFNPVMFDSTAELGGFKGPFNPLRVGFHEIGHTVSSMSGAKTPIESIASRISDSSHPMEKVRSLIQMFAEQGAEEARADLVGYKGAFSVPGNDFVSLLSNNPTDIKTGYLGGLAFSRTYTERILPLSGLGEVFEDLMEDALDQGLPEDQLTTSMEGTLARLNLASEKAAKLSYQETLRANPIGLSADELQAISLVNESKHLSQWGEPLSMIRARVAGETSSNGLSAVINRAADELATQAGTAPGSFAKLLGSRQSGGLSLGTLDRIIKDALTASKVMR